MKIWHISDTHTLHYQLVVPEVDMVIFSGDCSNSREIYKNVSEVNNFIDWFSYLKIKNKVFVGGNHDVSIEKKWFDPSQIEEKGITYLYNSSINIDGLKIWGSPYTPSYGRGWAWNLSRHKTFHLWEMIPDDTDIVVTHGPPQFVLDASVNLDRNIEFCGCKSLKNKIFKLKPKAHLFGHIHNMDHIQNAGIFIPANFKTIFSNASCITDRKFKDGLTSNGNIIEIK